MKEIRHSIKVAARLAGLSTHVIRIWEQRHEAVNPQRTATNRRIYSTADIERLSLLRQATSSGHSIGLVAGLSTTRLRELAASGPANPLRDHSCRLANAMDIMALCRQAIQSLDETALMAALRSGSMVLGQHQTLCQVVAPLAVELGEMWVKGFLPLSKEHFAIAVLRNFLTAIPPTFGGTQNAPRLVVATPTGQLHELGALLVQSLACNLGWQVIYLGVSLPVAEIAGAALQCQARAVALSLIYPPDDPALSGELKKLREFLPARTAIIVGGRASVAYHDTLKEMGAIAATDLSSLARILNDLRIVNHLDRPELSPVLETKPGRNAKPAPTG